MPEPQFGFKRIESMPGFFSITQRVAPALLSGAHFLSGRTRREGFKDFVRTKYDGETSMMARLQEARALIDSGASPNVFVRVTWQQFRTTPLFEAAVNDEPQLVKLLLQADAEPDAKVGPGFTALYDGARERAPCSPLWSIAASSLPLASAQLRFEVTRQSSETSVMQEPQWGCRRTMASRHFTLPPRTVTWPASKPCFRRRR